MPTGRVTVLDGGAVGGADRAVASRGVGGVARVYTRLDPSPDGRYILVEWLERPYSYQACFRS